MKERSEYSLIIPKVAAWNKLGKGAIIRLLHDCIENGFTTFDVSGAVDHSSKESSFGTALSESGLSRDEIQLIAWIEFVGHKSVEEQVEKLLLPLNVDYLDLLVLGDIPGTANSMQLLEELASQAKVNEFGITGLPPGPLQKIGVQVFQTSFELLSNEVLSRLVAQQSAEERWKVLIDWPTKLLFADTLEKALTDLVKKYEVSPRDLLMSWLLQHPVSFHLVVEGKTEKEINRFGKLKDVKLHPFDWKKIKLILTD